MLCPWQDVKVSHVCVLIVMCVFWSSVHLSKGLRYTLHLGSKIKRNICGRKTVKKSSLKHFEIQACTAFYYNDTGERHYRGAYWTGVDYIKQRNTHTLTLLVHSVEMKSLNDVLTKDFETVTVLRVRMNSLWISFSNIIRIIKFIFLHIWWPSRKRLLIDKHRNRSVNRWEHVPKRTLSKDL